MYKEYKNKTYYFILKMILLIISIYTKFLDNKIDNFKLIIWNKFPKLAKIMKITNKLRVKKNF